MTDRIAQQTELYGAPLAEIVRRITSSLGVSQSRVAQVLGMSAPMLSQLVTGARVKIGNPRAAQRLESLLALCDEIDRGLPRDQATASLDTIAHQTTTSLTRRSDAGSRDSESIQRLVRAVASGRELRQAAALLAPAHPDLAEMLLVYGLGDPVEAERHFTRFTTDGPH